jgi:putative membrane protein insertion efficiency factor
VSPGRQLSRAVWALATPVRWLLIGLVRLYKKMLSPLVPSKCRFYPSCSHYFIEAVERHGVVRGTCLGGYRILRCQPLCKGGFDPVP